MTILPTLSPNSTPNNLTNTLSLLQHEPLVTVDSTSDRMMGFRFSVNGVTVALKCPVVERANICLELLHDDRAGQWQDSWFFTCKAAVYLWVLPEGRHLWVRRVHLMAYEQHETSNIPKTNHNATTHGKLVRLGAPCNVVTKWVSISDVIDKTGALCYDVEEYNPETLATWLKEITYQ